MADEKVTVGWRVKAAAEYVDATNTLVSMPPEPMLLLKALETMVLCVRNYTSDVHLIRVTRRKRVSVEATLKLLHADGLVSVVDDDDGCGLLRAGFVSSDRVRITRIGGGK